MHREKNSRNRRTRTKRPNGRMKAKFGHEVPFLGSVTSQLSAGSFPNVKPFFFGSEFYTCIKHTFVPFRQHIQVSFVFFLSLPPVLVSLIFFLFLCFSFLLCLKC